MWMNEALCKGLHTDLFFPPSLKEERTAPESQYYEIAKMVCEQCPVRKQCEQAGEDEEFGVWGGITPKERRTGAYKRATLLLPKEHLSKLPRNDVPDSRVDIPALRMTLKGYTKRRSRKK